MVTLDEYLLNDINDYKDIVDIEDADYIICVSNYWKKLIAKASVVEDIVKNFKKYPRSPRRNKRDTVDKYIRGMVKSALESNGGYLTDDDVIKITYNVESKEFDVIWSHKKILIKYIKRDYPDAIGLSNVGWDEINEYLEL